MSVIYFIVESPGKIAKIQKILGSKYCVLASKGHILDLPPSGMNIDIENDFKPNYDVIERQRGTVAYLKKNIKSSNVILASDEDREGEFIAWSVARVLKLKDADRVVFNAITKKDIETALKKKRKLDYKLIDAQQTRRSIDRLFGYTLSDLTRKMNVGKSVGRVQTVAVRIIVDKETSIDEFFKKGADCYYKVEGNFILSEQKNCEKLKAILYEKSTNKSDSDESENSDDSKSSEDSKDSESSEDSDNSDDSDDSKNNDNKAIKGEQAKLARNCTKQPAKEVIEFLKLCQKSEFRINAVYIKKKLSFSGAPYMTATLQTDASNKLRFSVKKTMECAQKLYEAGLITYMRTDSTALSNEAMNDIKKYVVAEHGDNYYNRKVYANKQKNAQEAHEAIRPTHIDKTPNNVKITDKDQKNLYALIWRRAVGSQMKPAEYDVYHIQIIGSKLPKKYYFLSKIEQLTFEGYLVLYPKQEEKKISIPKKGKVKMDIIEATQDWSKPQTRYNEATLVKQMKNLGIGRPATYAPIISIIQERNYIKMDNVEGKAMTGYVLTITSKNDNIKEKKKEVLLGKENKRLIPTELGKSVVNYMIKHFDNLVDYKFTARMEDKLDEIACGKRKCVPTLKTFYDSFAPKVKDMLKDGKEVTDVNAKVLGQDPESGCDIICTIAKFGPVVKLKIEGEKCKYAPIKPPLDIKTIKLKDAIELLKYPIKLGKYERKDVYLQKGQYGLYLKYDTQSFPVKDNKEVSLEEAIEIIKTAQSSRKGFFENKTHSYTILKGQYGPYIKTYNKKTKKSHTTSISQETFDKAENLKIEEVITLSAKVPFKGKFKGGFKGKKN